MQQQQMEAQQQQAQQQQIRTIRKVTTTAIRTQQIPKIKQGVASTT